MDVREQYLGMADGEAVESSLYHAKSSHSHGSGEEALASRASARTADVARDDTDRRSSAG